MIRWPFEGGNAESIQRSRFGRSMGTEEVVRAMSQSGIHDNGEGKDRKRNGVVCGGDVRLERCSRVVCPDDSVLGEVDGCGVGGDAGAGPACHRNKTRGCKAGRDNVRWAAETAVSGGVERRREIFQGRIVAEKL